jgi:hypothetical protein
MPPKLSHAPTATVVWFDPGETTGVAVLAMDPRWLDGQGPADWPGLRRAIKSSWFAQLGAESKEWDGTAGKAITMFDPEVVRPDQFNGPPIADSVKIELNMIHEAREILDLFPGAAWGYEDYIPESMAAAQKGALTPMRFYSTLAFQTIMDDARMRVPFVQSRTMKYSADNARMKEAGLYLPGMEHATDAARHAAVFLRAARQKQAVRVAAWPRLFHPEKAQKRKAS